MMTRPLKYTFPLCGMALTGAFPSVTTALGLRRSIANAYLVFSSASIRAKADSPVPGSA